MRIVRNIHSVYKEEEQDADFSRTDAAKQFDSESCKNEEEKKEEKTEVADFRQRLYYCVQQSSH